MLHLGDVVDNESQRLLKFEDTKQWLHIPQIMDLFGRYYMIYHCCMDLCHWKQMLHLGWLDGYRMVPTCHRSLQIYCINMQWLHHLCNLLKQKRCGMYVSWLQGGGKYYVIILAISTKYFGSANPLKCCNTRRHKSMSSWDKVPIQHNGENWESTFLLTYGIVVVPHEVP